MTATTKDPITPKRMRCGSMSSSFTSPMIVPVSIGFVASKGLNEGDGRLGIAASTRRGAGIDRARSPPTRVTQTPSSSAARTQMSSEVARCTSSGVPRGLSDGGSCAVAIPVATASIAPLGPTRNPLHDLQQALDHVAACIGVLRGNVEAAKRRREFLTSAIRVGLVERHDGQFSAIASPQDRQNMIQLLMEANHSFAHANHYYISGFHTTMSALQSIATDNPPILLESPNTLVNASKQGEGREPNVHD